MTMAGIPRLLRRLPSDVLRLRRRRTAPGKPPTGYVDVYADATGALAGVDDAGAALSIAGTPASIANAGGSLAVDGSGNMLGITPVAGTITLRIGTSPTVGALLRMDGNDFTLNADDQAYLFLGGDNSAELTGGPAGGATYALAANGRLTIHAAAGEQVVLSGVPTSDPSVSDAVWFDGGVLVKSGSTAGGGGVFTLQRTPLSSADILALDATPIEVAPAPASGKANVLSLAWLEVDAGGTNYTTGGANVWIGYANDPLGDGTIAFFPAAALNNTSYPLVYLAPSGGSGFPAACKDEALVLQSTGALTGGTRTATLTTVWCQA
jgi:hypothetical protein